MAQWPCLPFSPGDIPVVAYPGDHPFPHSSRAAVIPAQYYPTALKELLQWHIETNGDHLVSDRTTCIETTTAA